MFWKTIKGSTHVSMCFHGDWWQPGNCLMARVCVEPERGAGQEGAQSLRLHMVTKSWQLSLGLPLLGMPDVKGTLTSI